LDEAPLRDFLERSQERAADMDEMATGELSEEAAPALTLSADGVTYELLMLSCMVDGYSRVAGIAAVPAAEGSHDPLRQTQLLQALASHLLEPANAVSDDSTTS
jgi:hypothetical protein